MDEAVGGKKPIDGILSLLIPKFFEPGANHGIRCIGHGNSFRRRTAYQQTEQRAQAHPFPAGALIHGSVQKEFVEGLFAR
jgi:hypothetical protein